MSPPSSGSSGGHGITEDTRRMPMGTRDLLERNSSGDPSRSSNKSPSNSNTPNTDYLAGNFSSLITSGVPRMLGSPIVPTSSRSFTESFASTERLPPRSQPTPTPEAVGLTGYQNTLSISGQQIPLLTSAASQALSAMMTTPSVTISAQQQLPLPNPASSRVLSTTMAHLRRGRPMGAASSVSLAMVVSSPQANLSGTSSRRLAPLTVFHKFSELPLELQAIVWKWAFVPRMVGLVPAKIPALAHTCRLSRAVTEYLLSANRLKLGIFMNPKFDILYFDKACFSKHVIYHISAYHSLKCDDILGPVLVAVTRVAFSVADLSITSGQDCFCCFLHRDFHRYFPMVKELILVLSPGTLGSGYTDLYEVAAATEDPRSKGLVDTAKSFLQHDPDCCPIISADVWNGEKTDPKSGNISRSKNNIKVTYMRLEKFAR